jgi:hypothetical protein
MRRAVLALIVLLPALSACGGSVEDAKVTATRIDDLDSLEGTISDEMADTGSLNEQPMIDGSPDSEAKPGAKKADPKPLVKPAPMVEMAPAPSAGE